MPPLSLLQPIQAMPLLEYPSMKREQSSVTAIAVSICMCRHLLHQVLWLATVATPLMNRQTSFPFPINAGVPPFLQSHPL